MLTATSFCNQSSQSSTRTEHDARVDIGVVPICARVRHLLFTLRAHSQRLVTAKCEGSTMLIRSREQYMFRSISRLHPFSRTASTSETRLTERRVVDIPATTLFDAVLDVNGYKEFLPFCTGSTVTRTIQPGACFEADLAIGFKAFNASYTSRVSYARGSENGPDTSRTQHSPVPWRIDAVSVGSSLFSKMDCHWAFHPASGDRTDVEFTIAFEVAGSSWGLQSVLDAVFEDVANAQVSAFEERCRRVLSENRRHGGSFLGGARAGGPLSEGPLTTGGPIRGRILDR